MGAPRLHEYLTKKSDGIKSFLLDIDARLLQFFSEDNFAWFNMFNNHFFLGRENKKRFKQFLTEDGNGKVLLFVDPPFGCRAEALAQTIKDVSITYQNANKSKQLVLSVFWIFPYYMETYVKNSMPEMQMCDYKVEYSNHSSYNNELETARKYGSPVRIFTNISLREIELPESDGYRHCVQCERWVAAENMHCPSCRECPSKNGQTYKHCQLCAICVKPNYVHCRTCGRCSQAANHSCAEYQSKLSCWICRKRGHSEKKCVAWKEFSKTIGKFCKTSNIKKGKRRCLICSRVGQHNEKHCPQRETLLKDFSFLGESSNNSKSS